MIEGADLIDSSITHVLLYLPANFCNWSGPEGFSLGARIPSLSLFSAGFALFFGLPRGGSVWKSLGFW